MVLEVSYTGDSLGLEVYTHLSSECEPSRITFSIHYYLYLKKKNFDF